MPRDKVIIKRRIGQKFSADCIDLLECKRKCKRDSAVEERSLLPVKLDGQLFERVTNIIHSNEKRVIKDDAQKSSYRPNEWKAKLDEMRILSLPQLYAERFRRLAELKIQISRLSTEVIQDPQANIHRLKNLQEIAENRSEILVSSTIQKLATASLLEVFIDIIPQYKIRSLSDSEKSEKAKKETRKLRNYEETLLRSYKRFLQHLEKWVKVGLLNSEAWRWTMVNREKKAKSVLGLEALCRLLSHHPHFNFRSNILKLVVQFANSKVIEVSSLCCNCLREVFRTDMNGEISLESLKLIASMVKSASQRISPNLLQVLSSLKLATSSHPHVLTTDKAVTKMDRHSLSKSQKKVYKESSKLARNLNEAEMDQFASQRIKMNTKILNHVITIYFLVVRSDNKQLLSTALEGLSHFAHLINIDFMSDLVTTLRNLIELSDFGIVDKLHCLNTVFILLGQEGEAFNIDPQQFYRHMFKLLLEVPDHINKVCFRFVLTVLQMMIIDRRKLISRSRAAAFLKRILFVATELLLPESVSLVVLAKQIMVAHPSLGCVFESETLDCGKYLWDGDDPEHSNVLATGAFEICLLRRYCGHEVRNATSVLLGKSSALLGNSFKDPAEVWQDLQSYFCI